MMRKQAAKAPIEGVKLSTVQTSSSAADIAPQERIIRVAREMFCRDGIHATGIDRILAAAGASKMTLYARFGSKGALLREVLLREGAEWRADFFAALAAVTPPGAEPLTYLVVALGTLFHRQPFYGCAFMNAIAEHTKGEAWLRDLAAEHHRQILDRLAQDAAAAGFPEPAVMARQLLLLLDGVIAALMVSADPAVLEIGERNLRAILRRD